MKLLLNHQNFHVLHYIEANIDSLLKSIIKKDFSRKELNFFINIIINYCSIIDYDIENILQIEQIIAYIMLLLEKKISRIDFYLNETVLKDIIAL